MRRLARARPTESPPPGSSSGGSSAAKLEQDSGTVKPAVKRPRKAINCEPCRTNKLKCDRKRPCSSCELRGTSSQCYRDTAGHDFDVAPNVDPLGELGKMRQALASLEKYYQTSSSGQSIPGNDATALQDDILPIIPEGSSGNIYRADAIVDEKSGSSGQSGPGSRGGQAGGYYAGPTSTASHLLGRDLEYVDTPPTPLVAQDRYIAEVLAALPDDHTINGIFDYYFMHCQWIYRRIVESIFRGQWTAFKSSGDTDCLVIATCCGVLALAMVYIPEDHPLKESAIRKLGPRPNETLYTMMEAARKRYEEHRNGLSYSLEYAEFLLLRAHYHLYATHDAEEVWAARSRMMCVATAMGLHRDPALWKMPVEVAERRRWLWWYILAHERWQSFVLGRPPSITNHHYDTQLPSLTMDPSQDMSTYAAALRMFRLTVIVGDILDAVLSLRPVPYSNIRRLDKALERWENDLPSEWMMSAEEMDMGLNCNDVPIRQRTLQITSILGSYYFIRLTLHRQYATRTPSITKTGDYSSNNVTATDSAESTTIAASCAEKLIYLSMRCRRDNISWSEHLFATRGHLAFHTFYLFSAAMFFSFQLIATPMGPRAAQCRDNITRAQYTLKLTPVDIPGGRLAANATKTLNTLAPLWGDDFVHMSDGPDKEEYKTRILDCVRTLAFPFHQSDKSGPGDHPINPTGMSHGDGMQSRDIPSTQPEMFGSSGILRPDMSVLGRLPIMYPGAYYSNEHGPAPPHMQSAWAPTNSAQIQDNGLGLTSMINKFPIDHQQPARHEQALPPDIGSHSVISSQLEDPLRAPVQTQSQSYAHGPSHDVYVPSVNSATHVFGRPPDVWGVSQEMPWGASVGMAAGEWAGFMQNMAAPPVMAQPPANNPYGYYRDPAQETGHAYRSGHM